MISNRLVRVASVLASAPAEIACGSWSRSHFNPDEVLGCMGWAGAGYNGYLERSILNYVVDPILADRAVVINGQKVPLGMSVKTAWCVLRPQ